MRPKFRLQAPNVKRIESPLCRWIALVGFYFGLGLTPLGKALTAQKIVNFTEEGLLLMGVFFHDSCSFERRPAVELLADRSEQARGFALVCVVVSAGNKQKLPRIGSHGDFLRLLDEIFVGVSRVRERSSRTSRFASGRLYQYVIDRETPFFSVWIRGTAAPPLRLIRIAIAVEIHGDAFQLMTAF